MKWLEENAEKNSLYLPELVTSSITLRNVLDRSAVCAGDQVDVRRRTYRLVPACAVPARHRPGWSV